MRRASVAALAALAVVAGSCGRGSTLRSAWRPLATRQVSFDAARAPSALEIRDAKAGWVERVALKDEIDEAERSPRVVSYDDANSAPDERTRTFFLGEMGDAAKAGATDLERAEAISLWLNGVIAASGEGLEGRASDDASADDGDSLAMYGRTKTGAKYTCLTTATIFFDAARAAGLKVRRVDLATRPGSAFETHAIDEVWDGALGWWVVVDPFFNHVYTVDGRPASALDLRGAVGDPKRVGVARIGGRGGVDASTYRIDPLLYFRNVSLRPPDGTWLAYHAVGDPVTPVADATVVQTEDDAPFRGDRSGRVATTAKLRKASERVSVQTIGGRVYVCLAADAFAAGACEIRADDGDVPSFEPDVAPYDDRDALLLGREELVAPGPSEAWTVSGDPTRSEKTADGLALEAGDAPCRVTVPFSAAGGSAFVAFCRAEVAEGSATFGIAGRRAFATVSVAPGGVRLVSSPILRARDRDSAVFELAPHARATLASVSVRRAKGFEVFGYSSSE